MSVLYILSLIACSICSYGQEKDVFNLSAPVSGSVSGFLKTDKLIDSLTIHMKRSGRLYYVESTIDGVTGNLIFDTGASGLVLNQTYFRDHIKTEGKPSSGITGSVSSEERVNVDAFAISQLSFKGITAALANLGHIENRRGIQVSGLFGLEMLKGFEVVIDLEHDVIHLYRMNRDGSRAVNPMNVFIPQFTEKFDFLNNVVVIKARVGGKNLHFCLDSGAEMNAINSNAPKDVLKTITITSRTKLHGVGAATNEVYYGTMNDFQIGESSFPGMETIVSDLSPLSEVYGITIDGMLGYGFLSKGVFCINFAKKQIGFNFKKPVQ